LNPKGQIMDRMLFALSLGLAAFALLPGMARAAAQCAPRDTNLATQFGESRRIIGLAHDNTVMELYAAETGTWTLTVTLPNGMTCLVAAGNSFEATADTLPAKGDPA
jgi:hypothetical protein